MRFIVLVLLCSAVTRADSEETEYRLKTAGVEPALRKRIHATIDRGVSFLVAHQDKAGRWGHGAVTWRRPSEAATVYATLALSHAGTPRARVAMKRGIDALIPPGKRPHPNLYRHVYVAGPLAMLLVASRSHPERALEIGDALLRGAPKSTWWGYSTGYGSKAGGIRMAKEDVENLSTAQFGALGLWASDRVRGKHARAFWRRHLESFVAGQMVSGSWRYALEPPWDIGGYSYYTGTFMGMANFQLAYAGSDGGRGLERKAAEHLADVREKAMRALDRDVPAYLQLFGIGAHTLPFPYYGLYALEKAAIFVDREEIGGVRWYVEGANALIATQQDDGGWHGSNIVDTAFALLFLLRSSSAYHPTTPRDVGRPAGPVSGTKPAGKPKPKAPAQPESIPVMKARLALDELTTRFRSQRVSDLPKPGDVAATADLESRLAGDAVLVEEWRQSWIKILWRVLAAPPRGNRAARRRWDDLQVACALALLRSGRVASRELGSTVRQGPLNNRKWEPSADWWAVVLGELLPASGDGKLAVRLTDKIAQPNLKELDRLVGYLRGVRKLAPKLTNAQREEIVGLMVRRFEGKESEWAKRHPGDRRELTWDMIGAHVMCTMRALTRDSKTGAYWLLKTGRPTEHLGDFRRWEPR